MAFAGSNVRWRGVFGFCVGVLAAGWSSNAAVGQAPPALDAILQAWEKTDELFFGAKSAEFVYERSKVETLVDESVVAHGMPYSCRVAYKGDKWLAERKFLDPGEEIDVPDLDNPGSSRKRHVPDGTALAVIKSRLLFDFRGDMSPLHATLGEAEWVPNLLDYLHGTNNWSLDAPKRVLAAIGAREKIMNLRESDSDMAGLPFLPEYVRTNRTNYTVAPAPESVDDVQTWVVEWPGVDRLHVDPSRGYAVVRRAYHWAPGKPMKVAIESRDFREVRPGLWLPFSQVVDVYASWRDEERLWGKVVAREVNRLISLEFDAVTDATFDVQLPPGTYVIDHVRDVQYRVGEDDREHDPFKGAITPETVSSAWTPAKICLAAGLGLLLVLVLYKLATRQRR